MLIVVGACARADGLGGPHGPHNGGEALREGSEATVRGVVVENTIDPCVIPQDTPCVEGAGHFLRLDTDAGRVSVYYAGHHGEPCPNSEANGQAASARVGQGVEVFARVEHIDPGRVTMSVCGSAAYYVDLDDAPRAGAHAREAPLAQFGGTTSRPSGGGRQSGRLAASATAGSSEVPCVG